MLSCKWLILLELGQIGPYVALCGAVAECQRRGIGPGGETENRRARGAQERRNGAGLGDCPSPAVAAAEERAAAAVEVSPAWALHLLRYTPALIKGYALVLL